MPVCTTEAATMRAAVWRLKERTSVERRRGVRERERRMKKILLNKKTVNAIKDFAQTKAGYLG